MTASTVRIAIIISTSTLASDAIENGGFGPVNDECYAVGYGIGERGGRDGVGAMVMSYGRDSRGFADCLEGAMREMRAAADIGLVE